MTSLTGNFERYVTVDCIDIEGCYLCGNYSTALRRTARGGIICVDVEECVCNRIESGYITEEEGARILEGGQI